MASFLDVLKKMNEMEVDENTSFQIINSSLLGVRASSKRKSASLEIAVPDETAQNFLTFGEYEQIGILLMVDRKKFLETNEKLEQEKGEMK